MLYRTLCQELEKNFGIKKQHMFITLIEVAQGNWWYDNGKSQFVNSLNSQVTLHDLSSNQFSPQPVPAAFGLSLISLVLVLYLFSSLRFPEANINIHDPGLPPKAIRYAYS